ncbi:MAG: nitroreductase/quinone reductase family protein [Desertimonas sp.]
MAVDDRLTRALAGHRTFDVTTTGRRTGNRRRIEIWYFVVDDDLYITGTPGRRDWIANLHADERLTVHITHGAPVDFDGRGEVITDVDERRAIMERIREIEPWYAEQGHAVEEWVGSSPLVRVTIDAV